MRITETSERECCKERDMVPYRGESPMLNASLKPAFCCHCGQLWVAATYTDEAGGQDYRRVRWSMRL